MCDPVGVGDLPRLLASARPALVPVLALSVGLALQFVEVLIPILLPSAVPLVASAVIMGAFTPGVPALVLGRLHKVTGGHDQHADWGLATSTFAVAQAASAYSYSSLYAQGSNYTSLFGVGALALVAALAASISPARRRIR